MKARIAIAAGAVGLAAVWLAAALLANGDKPDSMASVLALFRLGQAGAEDLQVKVQEVGVVDPAVKVEVKATVSGRVTAIRVREGARVRKGEVLAEVEPDVSQAQALSDVKGALARARVKAQDAERRCKQKAALLENDLIPETEFQEAKVALDLAREALVAAETRCRIVEERGIPIQGTAGLQGARVIAPMAGVIIRRSVEPGDSVVSGANGISGGTVLFTLADLDSLIVRVNLNEVDIAKVAVGQKVRVSLDAYPQRVFSGNVRFVAPAADLVEKIRVFKVEIRLDEVPAAFRTGMSANVEILGERREKAVSIPLEALQRREGTAVAYRLKKDLAPALLGPAREGLAGRNRSRWLSEHWQDFFEAVPVSAGIATLERVEVLSGLSQGDQVSLEDPTRKQVERDEDSF